MYDISVKCFGKILYRGRAKTDLNAKHVPTLTLSERRWNVRIIIVRNIT